MKKLIALLLALSCVFALCACEDTDSKDDSPQNEPAQELDLTALGQQMTEKMNVTLLPLPENMLLNQYGLSAEDCAQMLVYSDYDGTKCNEVWLVEAVDETALENVKTLAQNRVDSLLTQSNNYNADVYAASEEARIETRGLYLALVVTTSADSGEVMDLFLNA